MDIELLPPDEKGEELPQVFMDKLADTKLSPAKVKEVLTEFGASIGSGEIFQKAFSIVVTDESQKDLMKAARELRLEISKERSRVEAKRSEMKEPYLRHIQVLDGAAKIFKDVSVEAESHLKQQEKFAEVKAAERREALLNERVEALAPYVSDIGAYIPTLPELTESAWTELLNNSRTAHEKRLADQAEILRLKKEEDERLIRENERLQKEKVNADLIAAAALKEKEEADKKVRDAEEAVRREREENERKERERLEAEEAEKKRIADEKAKAAAAPIRDKILAYRNAISAIEVPAEKELEIFRLRATFTEALSEMAEMLRVDGECPF